jgi:hypothetical protein
MDASPCDMFESRGSPVDIATGYWLGDQAATHSSPGGVKNFDLSMSPKLVLRPTQSRMDLVLGIKRPGLETETHGTIYPPPPPHMSSWPSA